MAFPQGINFRATAGYVTDGTNEDDNLGGLAGDYPLTTAQGNTTGWGDATPTGRDRNSGNDRRLAGYCFVTDATNPHSFRVDLSTAGQWKIGLAAGDASNSQINSVAIYDNTTLLQTVCTAVSTSANNFVAANGTTYTAANWVAANEDGGDGSALITLTFTSTICNFRMLAQTAAAPNGLAHVYLELVAASGGGATDTADGSVGRGVLRGVLRGGR